jgi:SAM-dependent methyltransferase
MPASTYDDLPYEDYCFARTHPEHLFAVSSLCARRAPPFARCRVLELGCARGANLLPMALDLPGSELVGIDLSARQIDEGRRRVEALGLRNVTLRHGSITEVDARDGDFDYVVCHGVYSWVPAEVRDAILRVCSERLTPDGVAYVSFNALPGWNAARTVRDFLATQVPAEGSATHRLARARAALSVLAEAVKLRDTPSARWMRAELAAIAAADDSYVFHEFLEAVNEPAYLTDFVAAARAHGLAHLSDADLTVAAPALRVRDGDPVALAQSIDFALDRRFRAALLVREETAARGADPACLARLHLSTRAERTAEGFALDGRAVAPGDPWLTAALSALVDAERRPMAYAALGAAVGAAMGVDARAALHLAAARCEAALEMVYEGVFELHAGNARYASEAGIAPLGSALARLQCGEGETVTTLRHTRLDVPAFERAVLALLDGTRDRGALLGALRDRPEAEGREGGALAGRVEEALEWLARNALLAG